MRQPERQSWKSCQICLYPYFFFSVSFLFHSTPPCPSSFRLWFPSLKREGSSNDWLAPYRLTGYFATEMRSHCSVTSQPLIPAYPRGFFLIRKALFPLQAGEEFFLEGEADRGSQELLKAQLPYSSKFDLHLMMFLSCPSNWSIAGPLERYIAPDTHEKWHEDCLWVVAVKTMAVPSRRDWPNSGEAKVRNSPNISWSIGKNNYSILKERMIELCYHSMCLLISTYQS